MSRGFGWWGTSPLVVGTAGLLLLAFGAKGMQADDVINGAARQEAENTEKILNDAEQRREVKTTLEQEEASLKQRGKSVDLRSLAPAKGEEMTPDKAAEAHKRIYEALSDQRDPGASIAQCIVFYGGLILVFAAGVLLYLRTPESNRGTW